MENINKTACIVPLELLAHADWNTHNDSSFNDVAFENLVESIRKNGVVQRVSVRKTGENSYEIVDGHRRVEAAKAAGMTEIEADVYEGVTDEQAQVMTLVSNIQRADNDPILEAELIGQMFVNGMNLADVATAIGKDERYVSRRARLQELVDPWKKAYREYGIRPSVLEFVASHEANVQLEAWKECDGYDLSELTVSDVRDDVSKLLRDLGKARFDTDKCSKCVNNTACHPTLFGPEEDGTEKAMCQDAECFKRMTNEAADGLILNLREKGTKVVAVKQSWEVPYPNSDTPTDKMNVAYVYEDYSGFKCVKFAAKKSDPKKEKKAKTKKEIEAEKAQKKREKAIRDLKNGGFEKFRTAFKDVSIDEFVEDVAGTQCFIEWAKCKLKAVCGCGSFFSDYVIADMLRAMSDDAMSKYVPSITKEELDAILFKEVK